LGIGRILSRINVLIIKFCFSVRKRLLGFENAINYLRRVDKKAIIPILKKYEAEIGENCEIEAGFTLHNCKKSFANLKIGNNCHIGKNVLIDLKCKVTINNNVTMSMGCTILTHTDMGNSSLSEKYPANKRETIIYADTYLGANSVILAGSKLGSGSIVGATTLINKSFPNNSIIVGIPGKIIN
jgi:acetyltransferase-like isoleucine patch superfamily enzyme